MSTAADAEWWGSFFEGLALEAQRRMFPPERTRADADYLLRAHACPPGASLGDLPCGDGRIALELAARGFRMLGLDQSEPLLDDARREAAARGLDATFVRGDLRRLPWRDALDGAFCFGNSFAYMDDVGNGRFLRAVHDALRPGGRFVMETGLAAESILSSPMLTRTWHPLGDLLMLRDPSYDPVAGRLDNEYTFLRDGRSETRRASYRIYMVHELVTMFRAAGFADIQSAGAQDGAPYVLGSRVLYLTATKPATGRTP